MTNQLIPKNSDGMSFHDGRIRTICSSTAQKAILEKDTSTRENLLLQCGELLWSATSAMATSASVELTESVERVKTELWARLAAASLSLNSTALPGLSAAYALQALGERYCKVPYKVPPVTDHRLHLWRGVAHVLSGLALLATDLTM